ncbi:MAG: hypothetical protein A4E72_00004 [Syntrophus sp. PtaU1.Bin208]|nr:MAG: hypothetical protein A4E72_00004 [Syntrophus sp. PtaU1.Bin208]
MENFFIVPRQTYGPFLLWISSIVALIPWTIYCLRKIEKSGVKRWGATGKLWTPYDKE